METKNHKITLEAISKRKEELRAEIKRQKAQILFSLKQAMAPSPAELKLHPFMQNLNKGMALFDGVMTGIKIIRRIKAFLKRMK